ncbi:hypothetical protein IQ07DRAFT_684065 [Pyrenochaeta sp. DS3sAY3a]|nr:hypothetical protein IQ07DRAFT_684065 [Pyrenochaeta sp. DS3sAY3a]
MENTYIRPPTPQPLLHRAPDKSDPDDINKKPSKYIVLLLAPTSVAGKVQIATSVATALHCPLFQGDSLHESSAKAALVGASRSDDQGKSRYQRMWMSKMIRTGLLFPEESRPANEGFFGFGGASSSTSTSRRGSASSMSSTTSFGEISSLTGSKSYISQPNRSVLERANLENPTSALMVLTHPDIEPWHKNAIQEATNEYSIGIIFIPLFRSHGQYDDKAKVPERDELPILRPLAPSSISGFTSFDAMRTAAEGLGNDGLTIGSCVRGTEDEDILLEVNVDATVEEITHEIVGRVQSILLS